MRRGWSSTAWPRGANASAASWPVSRTKTWINLDEEPDATVYVPFAWIIEAKLVLTDELLKRGADERAARLAELSTSDNDDDQEE